MSQKKSIDRTDFEIIQLLRKNARMSNKELAYKIDMAPSSCLIRVRNLQSRGVLSGFHAEIDPAALGIGIQAILHNPLTGVGVGRFGELSGHAIRDNSDAGKEIWKAAHNSIIQIGAETGVFGLTLFLLLSWNTVKIFARTSREARSIKLKKIGEMGLAGFLGMFTAAFFISQAYSFYWAFYIVYSVVTFRLLSNELALEGKKAKL